MRRTTWESAASNLSHHRDEGAEADILKDARESLEKLTTTLAPAEIERGKTLTAEYAVRYGKPAP